jgi:dihydroorotase
MRRDEKEVPFEQAPMGTTGLETAFAAVYTDLVLPGTLALELVVEKLTAGLGCIDLLVPQIAVGEPANLVLVDLGAEWVVGESGYESRSENCCFAGRRLRGRVLLTVAAGAVAYRERSIMLVTSSGGPSLRGPGVTSSGGPSLRGPGVTSSGGPSLRGPEAET